MLSPLYPRENFKWNDEKCVIAEGAFHSQNLHHPNQTRMRMMEKSEIHRALMSAQTGDEIKIIAERIPSNDSWESVEENAMLNVLRELKDQEAGFKEALESTKGKQIIFATADKKWSKLYPELLIRVRDEDESSDPRMKKFELVHNENTRIVLVGDSLHNVIDQQAFHPSCRKQTCETTSDFSTFVDELPSQNKIEMFFINIGIYDIMAGATANNLIEMLSPCLIELQSKCPAAAIFYSHLLCRRTAKYYDEVNSFNGKLSALCEDRCINVIEHTDLKKKPNFFKDDIHPDDDPKHDDGARMYRYDLRANLPREERRHRSPNRQGSLSRHPNHRGDPTRDREGPPDQGFKRGRGGKRRSPRGVSTSLNYGSSHRGASTSQNYGGSYKSDNFWQGGYH